MTKIVSKLLRGIRVSPYSSPRNSHNVKVKSAITQNKAVNTTIVKKKISLYSVFTEITDKLYDYRFNCGGSSEGMY
jgi:hypothetical protein